MVIPLLVLVSFLEKEGPSVLWMSSYLGNQIYFLWFSLVCFLVMRFTDWHLICKIMMQIWSMKQEKYVHDLREHAKVGVASWFPLYLLLLFSIIANINELFCRKYILSDGVLLVQVQTILTSSWCWQGKWIISSMNSVMIYLH